MERKDIDIKDTWDLSTIYQNHNDFYQDLEKAKSLIDEIVSFKGKICNSIDSFYNFLSTKEIFTDEASKTPMVEAIIV